MIKDAGRNIDFRECATRCLVRRVGTEQVNLLVISIHSVIPGLPGKRLMVSRLASQGCEALFLFMDRVSSLVLRPPPLRGLTRVGFLGKEPARWDVSS